MRARYRMTPSVDYPRVVRDSIPGAIVVGAVTALGCIACASIRSALTPVESAADLAASQGCDLLFLPTDPVLAPLCVSIADVVAAGAALGLDIAGASVADGGAHAAIAVRDPATNARVYAWLRAHGAVVLGS